MVKVTKNKLIINILKIITLLKNSYNYNNKYLIIYKDII